MPRQKKVKGKLGRLQGGQQNVKKKKTIALETCHKNINIPTSLVLGAH